MVSEHSRRKSLAFAGLAVGTLLSGCLDEFGSDDSAEVTPSQTASSDEPEEDGDESEEEGDDTEGDSGVEEDEISEEIVEMYTMGRAELVDGNAYLNEAIQSGTEGEHADTEEYASQAREHYEKAEQYFSDGVEKTYQIDNPDAREILSRAENRSTLFFQSAGFLSRSGKRAQKSEYDRAENLWDEAESRSNEAEQINLRSTDTLRETLDLE